MTTYTYGNGPNLLPAAWCDFETTDALNSGSTGSFSQQVVNGWITGNSANALALSADWAETGSQSLKFTNTNGNVNKPNLTANPDSAATNPVGIPLPVTYSGDPEHVPSLHFTATVKNGAASSRNLNFTIVISRLPHGMLPWLGPSSQLGGDTQEGSSQSENVAAGAAYTFTGSVSDADPTLYDFYFSQAYFGDGSPLTGEVLYLDALSIYQDNYPTPAVPPPPMYVEVTTADVLGPGTQGSVIFTPSKQLVTLLGAFTVLEPVPAALGDTVTLLASDNFDAGVLTWDVVARLGPAPASGSPMVTVTARAVALDYANGATQDLSALGLS